MKLDVKEMLSPVCITIENGEKLYKAIYPILKAGNCVELDFGGVKYVSPLFFNAAIGELYREFSQEELDAKIKYLNLIEAGCNILEQVREDAPLFRNEAARKKLSEILSNELELI